MGSFGKVLGKAIKALEKRKKKEIKKALIKSKIKKAKKIIIERKNIFIEPVPIPKPKGSIFFRKEGGN